MKLLAYISDKDLFAEFYRKKLARRLLFDRSASDEHERLILTRLKQQCGAQFTSKVCNPTPCRAPVCHSLPSHRNSQSSRGLTSLPPSALLWMLHFRTWSQSYTVTVVVAEQSGRYVCGGVQGRSSRERYSFLDFLGVSRWMLSTIGGSGASALRHFLHLGLLLSTMHSSNDYGLGFADGRHGHGSSTSS